MSHQIQKFFLLFLKVLKLLTICFNFLVNIEQFFIQEEVWWGQFHSHPLQWLWGQSTSRGIGLIELTEPFLNWITKHFLNIVFYKRIYMYFHCLYLHGTKFFVLKIHLYFINFWFSLGGIRCYSIKVSVFLGLFL